MAEDEYERAVLAVVAAAAECRRSMGEAADPVGDALTIMRGAVRVGFPGKDGDKIAELTCLGVVISALIHDGVAATDRFNAALAANGLPWRLAALGGAFAQWLEE